MLQRVSESFTRPANTDAYTANDLIANNATAGSVVPMTFALERGGRITRARLHKSSTGATNPAFALWLFDALPTTTAGDNAAMAGNYMTTLIGVLTGTVAHFATNGGVAFLTPAATLLAPDKTVYGLLVATGAYAPASGEVFTVTLEVEPL